MDTISNLIDALGARGANDLIVAAIALPIILIVFYVGRIVLRSAVDRRVRGIQASAMGFMSLDEMRKKGLISVREHKAMRSRMAARALQETQQSGGKPISLDALAAVEIDPDAAKRMIRPVEPSALVRASLAGLGREHGEGEDGWEELAKVRENDKSAPRLPDHLAPEAAAREDAERVAAQLKSQLIDAPEPPGAAGAPQPLAAEDDNLPRPARKKPAPSAAALDPLSDPIFTKHAKRDAAEKKKQTKDIDQLFAKGLISREEYERLLALFDKA